MMKKFLLFAVLTRRFGYAGPAGGHFDVAVCNIPNEDESMKGILKLIRRLV